MAFTLHKYKKSKVNKNKTAIINLFSWKVTIPLGSKELIQTTFFHYLTIFTENPLRNEFHTNSLHKKHAISGESRL